MKLDDQTQQKQSSHAVDALNSITLDGQRVTTTTQVLGLLHGNNDITDLLRRVAKLVEEDEQRLVSGRPSLIDLRLAYPTTGRDVIMGSM